MMSKGNLERLLEELRELDSRVAHSMGTLRGIRQEISDLSEILAEADQLSRKIKALVLLELDEKPQEATLRKVK